MSRYDIPGLIASQLATTNSDEFDKAYKMWESSIKFSTSNTVAPMYQPYYGGPVPTPNIPTKKTRLPDNSQYKDAKNSLKNYINNKSEFENILDTLFSDGEKLEYLRSMGWRLLDNNGYVVKGEPDGEFKRTFLVEEAFLLEITIKFKNLLLSKGTLKIKI